MTLKQNIQQGQELLKHYEDVIEKIQMLEEKKDDKASLEFLLQMQKMEFEGRSIGVKTRLVQMQREYDIQFEKDSAECNLHIETMINDALKYIGKEPKSITDKIKPLIDKYVPFMDQEAKNEIFIELKGHLVFLKTKYKSK